MGIRKVGDWRMTMKFDKSKLVKNLAQGNILAPFLDRALESFDEPWTFDYTEKEKDDAWHPSGDCTPSVTWLYEKAAGLSEPEKITGSLRKSFMVGHYWHQMIQHVILHKLEFCEPEAIERRGSRRWDIPGRFLRGDEQRDMNVKRQPYHWATGQGDIAPLITPRWRGVVDIKTMSSHQFKQGKLPDWAISKYTAQLNIYMDFFDEERGMILAVNKDAPHDFKEFMFARDQNLIDAIYSKWKFVSGCLDNDVVPTSEDDERFQLPI